MTDCDIHIIGMMLGAVGLYRVFKGKPFNWIDIVTLSLAVVLFFV